MAAKSIETLVSFNAGEFSNTLASRVDQQKYRSACLQLRNMMCLKTGPATRRPGTQFAAKAKIITDTTHAVRLHDFQFSVDTTFVFEFGHHYLRFYSNGAQVVHTLADTDFWISITQYAPGDFVQHSGIIYMCTVLVPGKVPPFSNPAPASDPGSWTVQSILEVPTPYDALIGSDGVRGTEVFQLQFCAINDIVYICHQNHPRYKLTRLSDVHWTLLPVIDMVPALLDQNATDTTIAASAVMGTTTLTASAPPWVTAFGYEIGSTVQSTGNIGVTDGIYQCLVDHVSGSLPVDIAQLKWTLVTIFQAGHVGAYWEIANFRDAAYVEYVGTMAAGFTEGTSASITAFGAWEVRTYGVWSADVQIQSSTDGGITWRSVRAFTGRDDVNRQITGTALQAQLYRIVVSNVTAPGTPGATDPRIVFECVDAFLYGIVQITAVANAYSATATVLKTLPLATNWVNGTDYLAGAHVSYNGVNYVCILAVSSATTPPSDATHWTADGYPSIYWSEGAWSAVRGYPRAITAFGQRIWCGFTSFEPQRVWGTQINDIENWNLGDQTLATDGVAFDLDAVGDGAILWMQAQDALFVGLVSAEWVISAGDATGSISSTSVAAHRQSRWGSNKNIPAKVVGDALVFVQRQGFSARQMLFSIVTSKYMSQDLTTLSEQILNGGAIQMAYQLQGQKNGFLWITTVNGELVGMTYELDQEIFGWHRHTTGATDKFESVAVIPGSGTNDDEVWVVVNRAVSGSPSTQRFIERLNPINWLNSTSATVGQPGYPAYKNAAYFVDSGVVYNNPTTNVFTGLGHLEGRTVAACINAMDYGRFVVTGGAITVTDYVWDGVGPVIAAIGLVFESTLQPMNLDVDIHTGVTTGLEKKVTGLFINFINTLACKAWPGTLDAGGNRVRVTELNFRPGNALLADPPLYAGTYALKDFPGDYGLRIPIVLFTDGPLPMTVLSVAVAYGISGQP